MCFTDVSYANNLAQRMHKVIDLVTESAGSTSGLILTGEV